MERPSPHQSWSASFSDVIMLGPNRDRAVRDDETGARRNYWGCARERNRRLARTAIRKRIEQDLPPVGADCPKELSTEWLDKVLWHVIKGKRSFFSLKCIQDNLCYFETTHSVDYLFSADHRELKGKAQMINWFGRAGYEDFKESLRNSLETFTIYEFAVWCRRWHIVGGLLIAGVNPCLRGKHKLENHALAETPYQQQSKHLFIFGSQVLRDFFAESVPLSLSGHVVQQVVEARRKGRIGSCPLCSVDDLLLCCDDASCQGVCELCWWRNVLCRLHALEDCLVGCSLCSKTQAEGLTLDTQEDKSLLRQESLKKYLALPEDIKALREQESCGKEGAARNARDDEFLATTWTEALGPSMGPTREIRRDRFFIRITKGNFQYVKGILAFGIDVNVRNEYGQTGLYIAAWLGHERIVKLLLDYDADMDVPAHGGSTAVSAAMANGHDRIVMLLVEKGGMHKSCGHDSIRETDTPGRLPAYETLIDLSANHPGAGSFIIDNAISEGTLVWLDQLWKTIPFELTAIKQKKNKICSDRSYYCDTEGFVRKALARAIRTSFGEKIDSDQLVILEHMRFLSYGVPGSVLLPHTDLHRVDLESGVHSTHTFILYLTSCNTGGETSLLGHTHGAGRDIVLAKVKPRRGRLLLFPHLTPHEGQEVVDVPKLLIRGEVILKYADS